MAAVPDRAATVDLFTPEGDRTALPAPRAPAPRVFQHAKLVRTGVFNSGFTRIRSWQDSAHIAAPLCTLAEANTAVVVPVTRDVNAGRNINRMPTATASKDANQHATRALDTAVPDKNGNVLSAAAKPHQLTSGPFFSGRAEGRYT